VAREVQGRKEKDLQLVLFFLWLPFIGLYKRRKSLLTCPTVLLVSSFRHVVERREREKGEGERRGRREGRSWWVEEERKEVNFRPLEGRQRRETIFAHGFLMIFWVVSSNVLKIR